MKDSDTDYSIPESFNLYSYLLSPYIYKTGFIF